MAGKTYHLTRDGHKPETLTEQQLQALKTRYGASRFADFYTVKEVEASAAKPAELSQKSEKAKAEKPE